MYTKDLSSLLRLLQTAKQSGRLLVEASGPGESPWQGLFHLTDGRVVSCVLQNKVDGRVILQNLEALRWLTSQEKLTWRMEEAGPLAERLPQVPAPAEKVRASPPLGEERYDLGPVSDAALRNLFDIVPQRTQKGSTVPANVFASREHRQVLTLIDGHRTVGEIVQLLNKPPGVVLRILQDLRGVGFIV